MVVMATVHVMNGALFSLGLCLRMSAYGAALRAVAA